MTFLLQRRLLRGVRQQERQRDERNTAGSSSSQVSRRFPLARLSAAACALCLDPGIAKVKALTTATGFPLATFTAEALHDGSVVEGTRNVIRQPPQPPFPPPSKPDEPCELNAARYRRARCTDKTHKSRERERTVRVRASSDTCVVGRPELSRPGFPHDRCRPAEAVDRLGRPVTCSPCATAASNDDQITSLGFERVVASPLLGEPTDCLERPLQSYAGGRGKPAATLLSFLD